MSFFELLLLLVGHVHAAAEPLGADDDAFFAGGHFQRIVLHVFAGPAEDRMQQLFFRRQFALALGRDLADEDVARPDARADADDAVLIEIGQRPLADVGNVARELFAAELGLADFDVVLLDVNRGERVVLHQPLADDDGVFEVVAVEGHERDEHVAAQGQFALMHGGAVGEDLALLDALALLDDRLLVQAGALVQADELAEDVFVRVVDQDAHRIDVRDHARALGADDHAAVLRDRPFHAGRRPPADRSAAAAPPGAACSNPSTRGWRRRARGTGSAPPRPKPSAAG